MQGEDTRLSLTVEGEGLPAEGALSGEGTVSFAVDGLELYGAPPPTQILHFLWSRTAAELPYGLELTLDWLHPETGLPAASVVFSGTLEEADPGVLVDTFVSGGELFRPELRIAEQV